MHPQSEMQTGAGLKAMSKKPADLQKHHEEIFQPNAGDNAEHCLVLHSRKTEKSSLTL